jgi:hypothetical protein
MTPGRRTAALVAVAAGGYAAAVLALAPLDGDGPPCPVRHVTGLLCPGCGSTRASWLLLHGDLAGAARHNALFLPALALLAARWLHLAAPSWTARLPRWVRQPTTVPPAAVATLAAVVVAFGVARNLPGLELLAPP